MSLNTRQIIKDCWTVDFYERFTKSTTIIGEEQVSRWGEKLRNYANDDMSVIKQKSYGCDPRRKITDNSFVDNGPLIKLFIKIGNGNIALCGANLSYRNSPSSFFDFYFHSCTADKAKELLIQCLTCIRSSYEGGDLMWYVEVDSIHIVIPRNNSFTVVFHTILYKNKEDMLKDLGPAVYQHGYDNNGYFTTISGGISAAMNIYPVDIRSYELDDLSTISQCCRINLIFVGVKEQLQEDLLLIQLSNGYIKRRSSCSPDELPPVCVFNTGCCSDESDSNDFCGYKGGRGSALDTLQHFKEFTLHDNDFVKCTNINSWVKDYKTTTIGISDDVYVILLNIKHHHNLVDDVFYLLCLSCLEVETIDSTNRLMSY